MTRVGKILESLNKRRRVFSEAWDLPNNLRDKKYIKEFLRTASDGLKRYVGSSPRFEDLSKYTDYKSKKLSFKILKELVKENKAMGILLEMETGTLLWIREGNYRNGDSWAYLINSDGTVEDIREIEIANYTGRSAKNTRGYVIFNDKYAPSYESPAWKAQRADPLDQVDHLGGRSTLFSQSKDDLVYLMKLRKALTKVKMELTKESILANAPKVEKAMNSGLGVELILDGETYLLYSGNNSQLPWGYKANFRYNSWILLDEKPALARSAAKYESVLDIKGFLSPDYKLSKILDSRGTNYSLMVYVDTETGEITLNKNFKWSKYRGTPRMTKVGKILESLSKRNLNCSLDKDFLKKVKSVGTDGIQAVSNEFADNKKFIKQVEKDVMDLISYAAELEKMAKKSVEYIGSDAQFNYNKLKSALSKLHSKFLDLPNIK